MASPTKAFVNIPRTEGNRDRFLCGQPPEIKARFDRYFQNLSRSHRNRSRAASYWLSLPYWKIFPTVLAARSSPGKRRRSIPYGFVSDVQWGQYCLYLFIRFQDDIFDGQSQDPVTIYASDQCLLEADRVFARYFSPQSWFWKEYRECLRVTTHSIVEVDALQRKQSTRPEELLAGYARVSAILKVGSAAVCAKLNQWSAYRKVSLFCDEMAKAGQIMDDLCDLEEDLARRRFNYAANAFRRSEKKMPRRARSMELLNQLRVLATEEQIHEEAKAHVHNASKLVASLEIPGMTKYLSHYLERIAMR